MELTASAKETILREARKDWKDYLAKLENYNTMVEDCAKRGYRPEYCFHGTPLWVDYDVMCPACESGNYTTYMTFADILSLTLGEYRATARRVSNYVQPKALETYRTLKELVSEEFAYETLWKIIRESWGRFHSV